MISLKHVKTKLFDPYISSLKVKRTGMFTSLNTIVITRNAGDLYLGLIQANGDTLYSYLLVNLGKIDDASLGFVLEGTMALNTDDIITDFLPTNKVYSLGSTPIEEDIHDHIFVKASISQVVPITDEIKIVLKNANKFVGTEPSRARLSWLSFHIPTSTMFASDGNVALGTTVNVDEGISPITNTFGVLPNTLPFISKFTDIWYEMTFKKTKSRAGLDRSWLELSGMDTLGNIITFGVMNGSEDLKESCPNLKSVIPAANLVCDPINYSVLLDITDKNFVNKQFDRDIFKIVKASDIVVKFFVDENTSNVAFQFITTNHDREYSSIVILPIKTYDKTLVVSYSLELLTKMVIEGTEGFESKMAIVNPTAGAYAISPALFYYSESGETFGLIAPRRTPTP